MRSKIVFAICLVLFFITKSSSQTKDSIKTNAIKNILLKIKYDTPISFRLYSRYIGGQQNNSRIDETFLSTISLSRLLTLQVGYRYGQNQGLNHGPYSHYKLELQSKEFWHKVRFLGRMSQGISKGSIQNSSVSNYLAIAEGSQKISKDFTALFAYGYSFTVQSNNNLDALPLSKGKVSNYPVFKVGLRYHFLNRGIVDLLYGSYSSFNPYSLNAPFTQVTFEYQLSKRFSFYSYYRRQYLNTFSNAYNQFYTAGFRFHFGK